jgi:hypothetical protein
MVEAIVKIAGSLFVGGLGLMMIVISLLVGIVLINTLWEHYRK